MGSRGVKPAWLQDVAVTATACTDPRVLRPGSLLATAVFAAGPLGKPPPWTDSNLTLDLRLGKVTRRI